MASKVDKRSSRKPAVQNGKSGQGQPAKKAETAGLKKLAVSDEEIARRLHEQLNGPVAGPSVATRRRTRRAPDFFSPEMAAMQIQVATAAVSPARNEPEYQAKEDQDLGQIAVKDEDALSEDEVRSRRSDKRRLHSPAEHTPSAKRARRAAEEAEPATKQEPEPHKAHNGESADLLAAMDKPEADSNVGQPSTSEAKVDGSVPRPSRELRSLRGWDSMASTSGQSMKAAAERAATAVPDKPAQGSEELAEARSPGSQVQGGNPGPASSSSGQERAGLRGRGSGCEQDETQHRLSRLGKRHRDEAGLLGASSQSLPSASTDSGNRRGRSPDRHGSKARCASGGMAEKDNSGGHEHQNENGTCGPAVKKCGKIPKLPMVRSGKKWYRARLLRDTATKVLVVEFHGFAQEGQPTWIAKDSDRLWRGSYKGKDWKYLGDGAWEPKRQLGKKGSRNGRIFAGHLVSNGSSGENDGVKQEPDGVGTAAEHGPGGGPGLQGFKADLACWTDDEPGGSGSQHNGCGPSEDDVCRKEMAADKRILAVEDHGASSSKGASSGEGDGSQGALPSGQGQSEARQGAQGVGEKRSSPSRLAVVTGGGAAVVDGAAECAEAVELAAEWPGEEQLECREALPAEDGAANGPKSESSDGSGAPTEEDKQAGEAAPAQPAPARKLPSPEHLGWKGAWKKHQKGQQGKPEGGAGDSISPGVGFSASNAADAQAVPPRLSNRAKNAASRHTKLASPSHDTKSNSRHHAGGATTEQGSGEDEQDTPATPTSRKGLRRNGRGRGRWASSRRAAAKHGLGADDSDDEADERPAVAAGVSQRPKRKGAGQNGSRWAYPDGGKAQTSHGAYAGSPKAGFAPEARSHFSSLMDALNKVESDGFGSARQQHAYAEEQHRASRLASASSPGLHYSSGTATHLFGSGSGAERVIAASWSLAYSHASAILSVKPERFAGAMVRREDASSEASVQTTAADVMSCLLLPRPPVPLFH